MNNATNSIALNLIFIILIFFETQIYLFFRQIKTSTLRLRKLRNNILLCFGTKEKRTFIHNLRLSFIVICGWYCKYYWVLAVKPNN
jgi:hypothetical protein